MDFIDLNAQQSRIKDKIEFNIGKVLDHGKYIMGPEIKDLEKKLSDYVGVKHGIACSSGTDALLLALMSYNVGPGDAIFTTPFTFIATAEVISLLGAIPVFVDIDPKTYNIDPQKLEDAILALKKSDNSSCPLPNHTDAITAKGIIPVDLFGLPADYDKINEIAKEHNLFVIEDGAQSFGAEYNGRKSCSLADVGCTSFFPAKPLGCYGDGGMCFTNDDKTAEEIRSLLVHGKGTHKYDNARVGINGRLDTLQAAILLAKFDIFPEEIEARNEVARRYNDLLTSLDAGLITPEIFSDNKSAWAQYSILAKDGDHRSKIQKQLSDAGIPSAIYYPKSLHIQTAFNFLGYKDGDFPISKDCSERIFSLPMHPYLEAKDQQYIADILQNK